MTMTTSLTLPSKENHTIPKDFTVFFVNWALLQQNIYSISRVQGNALITKWEDWKMDWAVITSEALIQEVTTTRKKYAMTLIG
jgi:hypothetical protein